MKEKERIKLRRLLRKLRSIRGRHTELISVYIPAGASLVDVINQLREERSTAENIKSKQVRKNVTAALDKIIAHLQAYRKTPANGLAVFCGNIGASEGETNIEIFAIEPPQPLKTKLYWCDQVFRLEPLEEMIREKDVYGIICLDRKEAAIAFIRGKNIEVVKTMESIVPGKTHKGGQSAQRFARIREGLKHDWLKKIGEVANQTFTSEEKLQGIIISGPGPLKNEFYKGDYMYAKLKKKVIAVVDTGYAGEYGIEETLRRAEDRLKQLAIMREKTLLDEFFKSLTEKKAVYGEEKVKKALEMGVVAKLLISEDLEEKFASIEEMAELQGVETKFISTSTNEAKQFLGLGGIGAILRFRIEI